jgi:alpha-tubulin suppressor-like RCC1 family protein
MRQQWMKALLAVSLLGTSAHAASEPAQASTEASARRKPARGILATDSLKSMVIGDGGSVWVWGGTSARQAGLWPEYPVVPESPTRMPRMEGAVSIATAGSSHSLALLEDGTIEAWGNNWSGQLGIGSTSYVPERVKVPGLQQVRAVSAASNPWGWGGNVSLAVREDGTVWAWGNNSDGQLGDGTTQQRTSPKQVPGLTGMVTAKACERFSLAVREDGTVWAWGNNGNAQLGNGSRTSSRSPVQVQGMSGAVDVACGTDFSLALKQDGTVWGWGNNKRGQLGDLPRQLQLTAQQVPGVDSVKALAAGNMPSLVLKQDGTVWAWGDNSHGRYGNGTQLPGTGTPQQVPGLHGVEAIAAGPTHALALMKNGSLWGWGYNSGGALGTGTHYRAAPVAVVGLTGVRQVDVGLGHSVAVRQDGTVWTWGTEPGSGTLTPERSTPTQVPHLTGVVSVSAGTEQTLVLKQDGTVWGWGRGYFGQLGADEGMSYTEEPVQTQGLSDVVAVTAGGYHSLALRADGTLWAWGDNWYGQLGDGTQETRYAPVQVTAIDNIAVVYADDYYSAAIRQDGSVWTWGGVLGPSDPPGMAQQVVGLPPTVALTIRYNGFYALAADGSIWTWEDWGPWSPPEVFQLEGTPTDVVSMAFTDSGMHVLRADGTVWSAGGNAQWTPMPGLTDVVALTGNYDRVHATRADGTVVSWGSNSSGGLGDGVSPLHLSPVRVPVPCRLNAVGQREGTPPCPAQP